MSTVAVELPPRAHRKTGFERLARLAAQALDAPTGLINLARSGSHPGRSSRIDAAFGQASSELYQPLWREVIAADAGVAVDDLRVDPRFGPETRSTGAVAYLGYPLRDGEGRVVGAGNGVHFVPRRGPRRHPHELRGLAAGGL
jgi:hypothetical protein